MPRWLVDSTAWLIALAMTLVAILPPARLDCRCTAPSGEAALAAVATDHADDVVDACCGSSLSECELADEPDSPSPTPDDHGCTCQAVCCVYARSAMMDGNPVSHAGVVSTANWVAMTGPQTSTAVVHAGQLLRPPRA